MHIYFYHSSSKIMTGGACENIEVRVHFRHVNGNRIKRDCRSPPRREHNDTPGCEESLVLLVPQTVLVPVLQTKLRHRYLATFSVETEC